MLARRIENAGPRANGILPQDEEEWGDGAKGQFESTSECDK